VVNAQEIQQAILNLCMNAEQAMLENHGRGKIRLGTKLVGDGIQITVQDDGPGIPADIVDRIFDPFFTTKGVGMGTGLGLSICYGIVQSHGGSIRVENVAPNGALFAVELPIVAPDGEAAEDAFLGSRRKRRIE
jgi:signal transduction histidine kinase